MCRVLQSFHFVACSSWWYIIGSFVGTESSKGFNVCTGSFVGAGSFEHSIVGTGVFVGAEFFVAEIYCKGYVKSSCVGTNSLKVSIVGTDSIVLTDSYTET